MIEKRGVLKDVSEVINRNGCCELAIAEPGGSAFCEAIYTRVVNPSLLESLIDSEKNITFLNGISTDELQIKAKEVTAQKVNHSSSIKFTAFQFDTLFFRCSTNDLVQKKNIFSFDIDFKDCIDGFSDLPINEKRHLSLKKVNQILPTLLSTLPEKTLWMVVYSGGGIHLHFKLAKAFDCLDKSLYSKVYLHLIDLFECNLSMAVIFDRACNNTARIMRLPLSVNLKKANKPIKTEVLYHDPNADASNFITEITEHVLTSVQTNNTLENKKDSHKEQLRGALTFKKILSHFGYNKFSTIKQRLDGKYWLSSPFSDDPHPSCLIDEENKVFFDFSTNQGGDVFSMIASLNGLDCKKDFGKVIAVAEQITGIEAPKVYKAKLTEDEWFEALNGQIFKCYKGQNGVSKVPLSNFFAYIASEETHDDGQERIVHLTIDGKLASGSVLPQITIQADHFSTLNWVTHQWGIGPVIYPGYAAKDQLRSAIQLFSQNRKNKQVFTHLGWRQIDDVWVFLHASGAVGSHKSGVIVDAGQNSLMNYRLPLPSNKDEFKSKIKECLQFLELLPSNIAYPLLGAVFRTPLNEALPIDYSIFLFGKTGTFKSELASIVQSFFGDFHAKNLPGNWSSTANSLERLAFLAKDVIFCIDDYAPEGGDSSRLQRDAERLIRNQGNKAGRDRMFANGKIRPKNYPRGMILATGEDIPRGHSIRARMAILELAPGIIQKGNLTKLQRLRDDKVFASVMSKFISWLCPKIDKLKNSLADKHREFRLKAHQSTGHLRTPDIAASLYIGIEMFSTFAFEVGSITEKEKVAFCKTGWEAIGGMAQCQGAYQTSEEPAKRVVALLTSALISGRVHLADAKTDGIPDDPGLWGWVDGGYGFQSKGEKIGWVNGDELYFDPDMFFVAVNKVARDQGQPFSITKDTLLKQMAIDGIIKTVEENNQQRNTLKRTIGSAVRKRLLVIPNKGLLLGFCSERSTVKHPVAVDHKETRPFH